MSRQRSRLTPDQEARLGMAQMKAEGSQQKFREAVVQTLTEGASFSAVAEATGLSTNTLQRWKREAAKN